MTLWQSVRGLTLVTTLACAPAESQSPRIEAKLPARFTTISNVVELRDGRIVFADTEGKLFIRADLKTGKTDTLGTRVDSLAATVPAREYKFPGWVAHL